jgi:signal transduction histidine kinase
LITSRILIILVTMLKANHIRGSIKSKFYKFSRFAEDEIFFPKDNFKSILFRYLSGFLFSAFSLALSLLFNRTEGTIISYLLFFLSIVLSALVGGFGVGVMSSFIAAASIFLIFYPFLNLDLFSLFEIGIFLLIGALTSLLVIAAKRIDLVNKFNLKEKEYLKEINKLEKEVEKAKEEIKVRDEFISIASHELKTPLTTTLLKLQTALHNVRNVSLANFSVQNLLSMLESAEQQTKRLSKMINDFLNVSLIRTGRLELEYEDADLTEITKEIKDRFSEKLEKENIQVKLDTNGPVTGRFDKLRIEQVLTNLLSNALKYGAGKSIEIKVVKESTKAKIFIKDHGIGIPDGQRVKIFELFERAVQSNSYKGLGVGLYISNQIIRAHNGNISVDSKEGKGSTFIVELPLKN